MRKRRANIVTSFGFLAITSFMAIACTAGSGPLALFDDPYDKAPDSREKPGDSRDNPTLSGRDNPPGTIENPGTLGGGPAGGNGCPPCDGTFKCTNTVQNQTKSAKLVLKTVGGQCVGIDSKGKPTGTLACGGAVIDEDGKSDGTWTASGSDGFVVTGTTTTTVSSNGSTTTTTSTTTVTCTRESNSTTPIPTTTSTGTGSPPAPTTTATTNPVPPTIIDAGTQG
jgi:hypothetical protein